MNDKTTAAIEAIMGLRDEIASANTMRAIAEQQRDEAVAERDAATERAKKAEDGSAEAMRLLVEASNKEDLLAAELRDANDARDKAMAEVTRMRQEIETLTARGAAARLWCETCRTEAACMVVPPAGWEPAVVSSPESCSLTAPDCPNCRR